MNKRNLALLALSLEGPRKEPDRNLYYERDNSYYRDMERVGSKNQDQAVWLGAARAVADDLEREGHKSPARIPPRELAIMVKEGLR